MALPVMELYALFLERRPEEKERVEQARLLEAKVCMQKKYEKKKINEHIFSITLGVLRPCV